MQDRIKIVRIGHCHLCGAVGELSYEHVPPRKAFNDQRVLEAEISRLLMSTNFSEYISTDGARENQAGAGAWTLCHNCNNKTGSWYGGIYVEWARQGMRVFKSSSTNSIVTINFDVYPLRVLKQVLVMFASACAPGVFSANFELQKLIFNKYEQRVPEGMRLFVFMVHPSSFAARQSSVSSVVNLEEAGKSYRFAEICFPPFGYILTFGSDPINKEIVDITYFEKYSFAERVQMTLSMPVLSINSHLPGDFRTMTEIEQGFASR